jgi:7-cyano-7-deazaguanine synthase in queuosine biosynthesis
MSLVLWSGGCDSTLVLYEQLKEARIGPTVKVLSIEHGEISAPQRSCEAAAREKIIAWFKKQGLYNARYATLHIRLVGNVNGVQDGYVQPQFWLGAAVALLYRDEDAYMAYLEGELEDRIRDVVAAFDSLQAVSRKVGKLRLPLRDRTKASAILQLRSLGLYDLCWYCEEPKGVDGVDKPCGKCGSCRSHRLACLKIEHGLCDDDELVYDKPVKVGKHQGEPEDASSADIPSAERTEIHEPDHSEGNGLVDLSAAARSVRESVDGAQADDDNEVPF